MKKLLNSSQKKKIISILEGKILSGMIRYAGCQRFNFKEKNESINNYGLLISCYWEMKKDQSIILSYMDFYPNNSRSNSYIEAFYDLVDKNILIVSSVNLDEKEDISIKFTDGYTLLTSVGEPIEIDENQQYLRRKVLEIDELWRFMAPKTLKSHLIYTKNGYIYGFNNI